MIEQRARNWSQIIHTSRICIGEEGGCGLFIIPNATISSVGSIRITLNSWPFNLEKVSDLWWLIMIKSLRQTGESKTRYTSWFFFPWPHRRSILRYHLLINHPRGYSCHDHRAYQNNARNAMGRNPVSHQEGQSQVHRNSLPSCQVYSDGPACTRDIHVDD